jgi:hypothetical protein
MPVIFTNEEHAPMHFVYRFYRGCCRGLVIYFNLEYYKPVE